MWVPPKDGGEWSVDELKECAVLLCLDLVHNEVDLSKAVPHAAFAGRGQALEKLPPEEVKVELQRLIQTLEERIPEPKKKEVLLKLVEHLQVAKNDLEFTKKRIDSRVQPEGTERTEQPFHSFCKRKKEW